MAEPLLWKKNCLDVRLAGFCRRASRLFHIEKQKAERQGAGTNSRNSGTRNLEAESITEAERRAGEGV